MCSNQSEMSRLIEAIPDDLALRCLAYVPLNYHPNLELVSRSWRAAIRSAHLFQLRNEVKSTENLLCVCAFDPENIWQVYSPTCDGWLALPLLPSNIPRLSSFGAVTIGRKLFVLGGSSIITDRSSWNCGRSFATNEVWSYDFVERQWTQRASMLLPRAKFACCVLDGNIIVSGGRSTCRKSLSEAEIYNRENDVWTALPDLQRSHNTTCSGIVLKDKVHVFHKGESTVQVLESVELGWVVKDHNGPHGPMAVIEDVPYVMSEGVVFKQEGETWKEVALVSEMRMNMAMTSFREEVLILGGMGRPNQPKWEIKPQPDVDALTFGNDQPMWRKLAPMTRCNGTIIACTQLTI